MDIKKLKYFLTIAEEGSITAAAKKLHMFQPPLSQQLKLLEEELEVKLFERRNKKIYLTEAGRMLHGRAEQILELTDSTLKEFKDLNKGIKGTLKIGTVSTSGAALIPGRISSFNVNFPDINFEIFESNTYKVLDMLTNGLIDIGIVRTPFNMESFSCILLPLEPMIITYNENLFIGNNSNSISLRELKNKPLIVYRRFEKIITEACQKAGFEPNYICINDDARTTLQWATSGIGIGIVPKSSIAISKISDLLYKEIEEASLETRIAAIWMKNHSLSVSAKNFLELFKKI